MQKLAELCIQRPVFATMLILAMVVVGTTGYVNLGVDRVPSVDLPTVRVQTSLPGAAPEEVETEVTYRVEEVVNTVEGIDQLRSISVPGSSIILVTFGLGRNIDVAAQDVRDRVATVVRDLPVEARPPVIAKVNNDSDPVLTVALAGSRSVRELTELADKVLKIQLERSTGVGEVRISGGLERAITVSVDSDKLVAYQLPITAVRDAIQRQNTEVPGGNVTGMVREQSLRTQGKLTSAREFEDVVISTIDGVPIRIRDIGTVEDGTKEQRSIARLDGVPTVTVEIQRQTGANTVEVIEGCKAKLEALKAQLPSDVHVEIIRDQSQYIYNALGEIRLHLVLGSILASLVVLAFMRNLRATFIAAIAIPTSVIATFGMMWALKFTLNSVTMLALVLMVGVVIDDAIVVLENIFRFIEEKRMPPMQAAKEATREIGLAVLATTLSLVVIFVPVSFMSSVSGRFLYQFGITAAVSVLVSLLVSFTLTPMMSARLLRTGDTMHPGGLASSRRGFYHWIDKSYEWMLRVSLRFRVLTGLFAIAVIACSVPLFDLVKQEFVPSDVDEAEFTIQVNGPEGTSLPAMDDAMRSIESMIRQTRGVKFVQGTTGGGFLGLVNTGTIYVRIAPHEERVLSLDRMWRELVKGTPAKAFEGNYSQTDVMTELDRRLRTMKDLRCQIRAFQAINLGGGPFDIDFVVRGPELSALNSYGEELRKRALEIGGFRGLDTSLRVNKPEVKVEIDRERAADLGVDARDIGTALRIMVGGDDEVSRFRDPAANEDYDVELRLLSKDRDRPDIVENLYLPGKGGTLVEVGNIARLSPIKSASRVDRMDRQRMVSVRGGVAQGFALGDRIAVLRGIVRDMNLPAAYSTTVSGRSRELERTSKEFIWAFILSVVFMYLILASQFESVIHPFTILLSLPLSIPFALLSLHLVSGTLNLYSALGILVLFGVVKKNAILQIDHMNALRSRGMSRFDAIIQANRDRLRPILMTTFALVAGMLPLAFGAGPGAEERRAVAVVVIGGQTFSLLLTLLVTPVAYSFFDDLRPKRFRDRAPAHAAESNG